LRGLNTFSGVFYLVEKKKKEREGRKREFHLGWVWRTRSTARWDPPSEAQHA
jgi:hypothetical protein